MRFEIYPELHNPTKSRWRLLSNDGRTLTSSPERYNGVGPARRAIKAFCKLVDNATVSVLEPIKESQRDT